MKPTWLRRAVAATGMLVSSVASADDFEDYRIPAHHLMNWSAGLGVQGNRLSGSSDIGNNKNRDANGSAASAFYWISDSDPVRTDFRASGLVRGNGNWSSDNATPGLGFSSADDASRRQTLEAWSTFFSHRRYPLAMPLAFEFSVLAGGGYQQGWDHQSATNTSAAGGPVLRTDNQSSRTAWTYDTRLSAEVGGGLGRRRDASAVYEAQILESRMMEDGTLTRHLSPNARARLISLMAVRNDYVGFRERPSKLLWERIAAILDEDGALVDSSQARGILRAAESFLGSGITADGLPRSATPRWIGVFAGVFLTNRHEAQVVRFDDAFTAQYYQDDTLVFASSSESHFQTDLPTDETLASLRVEASRPLGTRWQLDLFGNGAVPLDSDQDGFELFSTLNGTFMVSDRWFAQAYVIQQRIVAKDASRDVVLADHWLVNYGASASYYLEDRLVLSARVDEYQAHSGGASYFTPNGYRQAVVSLSLNYRILGGFEAPGLIAAQTLAVPR